MPRAKTDIQTVALVSLGCPKNLVDSEKMLGLLAEAGLVPVSDHRAADAIVINTCGFLEASRLESLEEIQQAAKLKAAGSCKRLVVAGCLVQRHRAKLLQWCPDIDALVGVFDRDRITTAVRPRPRKSRELSDAEVEAAQLPGAQVYSSIAASATMARRQRHLNTRNAPGYFEDDAARLRLTPRHYAYLRISEGCNQNCAFCTIPSIRGKMRSKPVARIVAEACELIADGAFELNLIGQDTTSFGDDIGYGPGLAGMLTALDAAARAAAGGNIWLRLMYAYPSCFTDEMVDAIGRLAGVVKYIDMPLQHIADPVLTAMRRHTSRRLIETLLAKLRDRVPGIALRTTFISGFPGETDEQHAELVRFVREFGFEAMGVFGFSPEPGTPAGTMHARGQAVPEDVVRARIEELMLAQQEVAFARNERLSEQGVEFDVLIDAPGRTGQAAPAGASTTREEPGVAHSAPKRKPAQGHLYTGRTYQQAPQIDGLTYVVARQKLVPGELVRCRVTDAAGYDLVAQPVEELANTRRLPVLGSSAAPSA